MEIQGQEKVFIEGGFIYDDEGFAYPMIAGGAPDEGSEGDGGEGQVDQGQQPPTGDQGGQGQQQNIDPSTGEWIPRQRFNEVNTKYGRYKKFGTPEEIEQQLTEYRQWKQQVEQYRQQQQGQQQNQDPKARIRQQLMEVAPEFGEISEIKETLHALRMEKASNHLGTLLKEKVPGISPKMQDRIEDYVLASMTEEQSRRFNRGDLSVLDEFVDEDLEAGLLGSLKSSTKGGNPPPKPPIRHGPGGTPPKPPSEKKFKTLKEAEDAAWERISASKQE